MDFTLRKYHHLIKSLQDAGFSFLTFTQFLESQEALVKDEQLKAILRHDVDLKPHNSLATAKLENSLGITGSYYFRAVPQSWNESIIKEIAALGHEIGYHYENLTTFNGNFEAAYNDFLFNLEKLRKLTPVSTICMHGSPRSKWDSKDLWKHYNYKELGITGEPYFDIDFDEVFYLTDTGRRWDGWKSSVRDKVPQQDEWIKRGLIFRTTNDIINAANTGKLPHKIMLTIHPQRWNNSLFPWMKELISQKIKNQIKKLIIKNTITQQN
jgi:hypothetical protein